MVDKDILQRVIIEAIAARMLGIPTLERRNRDDLDMHEVSVWMVTEALESAFTLGFACAKSIAPLVLEVEKMKSVDRLKQLDGRTT